jgi:uncharacterized membrane protein YdjX (TVP38/TMEM64 family)
MKKHARLIGVALFLALMFAVLELSGIRAQLNLDTLQRQIHDNQVSGLLIFVFAFALGNIAQIPGWVFLAAAVFTLGKTVGGLATYIAASLSCVATFFTIRLVGGNALRTLDSPLAVRLLQQFDAHPIRSIVLLRMGFQTLPALNYTLALTGVKFRNYLIGTLLGLPLPIALYCLFFDFLARALNLR